MNIFAKKLQQRRCKNKTIINSLLAYILIVVLIKKEEVNNEISTNHVCF